MDEKTRQKIIQWVFDNHDHHDEATIQEIDGTYSTELVCTDGEYPYVNSLELEKFIKSL